MRNIIVYKLDGTQLNSIAQWDRDVYFSVREADITQAYKLHFFNSESEVAYVVESTYEDGVLTAKIPNVLAMQPFEIVGYVYDEGESGSGQSLGRFRINVISKPMPSDAIYPGTVDYLSYAEIMENCREFTISEYNRVVAENARAEAEENRLNAEQNRTEALKNALEILTIQDPDNNKQYNYKYVIKDGHLGIVFMEATQPIEQID